MKHRGQYTPCRKTDTPDRVYAVLQKRRNILSVILLHKRKNAVSFQKLVDEQPSLLRPTSMQLRIRIAVFV